MTSRVDRMLTVLAWCLYIAGAGAIAVGMALSFHDPTEGWRWAVCGVVALIVGVVIDLRRFTYSTHQRQIQIIGEIFDRMPERPEPSGTDHEDDSDPES